MRILKILYVLTIILLVGCKPNFDALPSENNTYNLTTAELLEDESHTKKIEEFYEEGLEGAFMGKENISIYYKIFQQAEKDSPAILISTGRTEAAIKYKEVIFDLFNRGYAIYIHDHRGQGLSGRMTRDPEMGYIDNFQNYIDDMKHFYDQFIEPGDHKKIYLLAHSMGGAIGMTYLEQFPGDFKAAAFSSPMLGLSSFQCAFVGLFTGKKPRYAPTQGKYKKVAFKKNQLTGSEIRYNRIQDAFSEEPKARLGGATYQWAKSSCKQFKYMNSRIANIETPFILFSADHEQIVNTGAHEKFVKRVKKLGNNCSAFLVENAQHELLVEKDPQRIGTMNQILKYFEKY